MGLVRDRRERRRPKVVSNIHELAAEDEHYREDDYIFVEVAGDGWVGTDYLCGSDAKVELMVSCLTWLAHSSSG